MKQMRQCVSFFFAGAISAYLAVSIHAAETNQSLDSSLPAKVDLQPLPMIKFRPKPPVEPAEETNILRLIRNLAKIQTQPGWDSPMVPIENFAPMTAAWREQLLTPAERKTAQPDDFTKLVELGPRVLPFLLASLDNPTPTQMVITPPYQNGFMQFAGELPINSANDIEQKVWSTVPRRKLWPPSGEEIYSYTVTVGDVCFDIIGQIVGRKYHFIGRIGLSTININSPVHDTNLAAQVRAIWSGNHPDEKVFHSLLLDFASRGVFNGHSLDSWNAGSSLQITAASRLLYCYPAETTNLIARRLHDLNVEKDSLRREVKNGVRANEFIAAVAWSPEPAIQSELRRIFRITKDPDIFIRTAALMNSADKAEILKRFEKLISSLPDKEDGPYGDGYRLLMALGNDCGDEARPIYEHYLRRANLQRKQTMCQVLENVHRDWSIDLLGPLLADATPAGGDYGVVEGQNEPRLPIRICDWAADAISHDNPGLKFAMVGQHSDLDMQIQKIREQIKQHAY